MKVIGKKGQNNRSVLYSCHLIIHCPFITQWYLSPLCISYLQSTVRALDAKMPFSWEQFRLIGVVCSAFMLLKMAGVHYGEGEQGAAGDAFI